MNQEQEPGQYDGRLLQRISAWVEKAERTLTGKHGRMDAVLAGEYCPGMFLADARTHLADGPMDRHDAETWEKLGAIQDRIFSEG
jgi:hypothetical protein